METNEKIERLLDMTEHPEHYTEEEMQQLLQDEECREYYELMVKTDNALTPIPGTDVEGALQEFESKHVRRISWRKIAAVFIGILMISGITYAAISLTNSSPAVRSEQQKKVEQTTVKGGTDDVRNVQQTDTTSEKAFDNVELQTILNGISSYYQLDVVYHSDRSRHLRLHFRWDKKADAGTAVESLNHFENVNITLTDHKIDVE